MRRLLTPRTPVHLVSKHTLESLQITYQRNRLCIKTLLELLHRQGVCREGISSTAIEVFGPCLYLLRVEQSK